ncbi:MAG TPA: sulfurtransferase complex subunit TusC [Pseudomonadales bacterium]|nr:sulfurtransferase complex subunit TusC [Pseudomonadales bacterium]
MKKILFVFQSPPYADGRARDGIDAALVASAFGAEVSVLFCGDATYQLIGNQNATLLGGKSIEKLLRSFDLYDIHRLFVEKSALLARGLTVETATIDCAPLEPSEIRELLLQHDIVMSF